MLDTLDDAAWREIAGLLWWVLIYTWTGLTLILIGRSLRRMALTPEERQKLERQQRILGRTELAVKRHKPKSGQKSFLDHPRRQKPSSKPEGEQS